MFLRNKPFTSDKALGIFGYVASYIVDAVAVIAALVATVNIFVSGRNFSWTFLVPLWLLAILSGVLFWQFSQHLKKNKLLNVPIIILLILGIILLWWVARPLDVAFFFFQCKFIEVCAEELPLFLSTNRF